MGPDFQYDLPENTIDDDFFAQAGGLVEGADDGELVSDELSELSKQLFDSEPEIIHLGPSTSKKGASKRAHDCDYQSDDDDDDSYESAEDDIDSDDYNVDLDQDEDWMDDAQLNSADLGRKLIAFKEKQQHKHGQGHKGNDSKSVFTDYSMTSSILRKNNEGLQKVDDHFEKLFERHYADDTEIGARDMDDVQGEFMLKDPQQIKSMINEVKMVRKKNHGDDYKPEIVSDHHRLAIIGEDPDDDEDLVEMEVRHRENRVDCESILSYASTLYNHPKLIVEPRRKKRNSGCASVSSEQDMMMMGEGNAYKTDRQSIASSRASILSKLSVRPPNETQEEKRRRKKALKMFRHERRQERKSNQTIFKLEEKNIVKQQRKVAAMKLA